jgi:hypothetical protein
MFTPSENATVKMMTLKTKVYAIFVLLREMVIGRVLEI